MAVSRSGGIPGIAVALAMAGGYFIFVGIKDVSFVEGVREMLKGIAPTGKQHTPTELPPELRIKSSLDKPAVTGGGAGSVVVGNLDFGKKIAETALQYKGVPYHWGGETPSGWDCSGLVYFVLKKVGVNLTRMTSGQYVFWKGASTVPRAQCQAGDLVIWPGHIGIAISNTDMINAPTFGIPTRVQKIWGTPICRRVKAV